MVLVPPLVLFAVPERTFSMEQYFQFFDPLNLLELQRWQLTRLKRVPRDSLERDSRELRQRFERKELSVSTNDLYHTLQTALETSATLLVRSFRPELQRTLDLGILERKNLGLNVVQMRHLTSPLL